MANSKNIYPAQRHIIKNPSVIIVNFLLAGIVVLFLALSYGYIFAMGSNWIEFKLPKVFWLSTAAILCVSLFLHRALKMFDLDKPKKLTRSIMVALFFSVLFVFFQISGWSALLSKGLDLQSSPSVSYLYILTGLHVAHVAVGIIFLIVSIFRSHKNTTDNVKALLYFSDPIKRSRLKLLNTYWHTIDFLWVYLFLAFLFHHA